MEITKQSNMIKRELYLKRLRPFYNKNIVKILTGMRRSGKSVMLSLIQDELIIMGVNTKQIITINFESAKHYKLKKPEALYELLIEKISMISGKAYLFLDEIQEVENWQTIINSLLVDHDVDIYITGSNAKLLSGELATYLSGRYIEIQIFPFSFVELKEKIRQTDKNLTDMDILKKFLRFGGMPFLFEIGYGEDSSLQYLSDIYNSVVLKDVVQRNSIRDVDLLERLLRFVISNISLTFSSKSISDYLKSENRKVAPETIINYMKACVDAFLFQRIPRQDLTGKGIMKTQEKIYLTDHGIRETISGKNNKDIEKVLENIVCIELLRRGYRLTVGNIESKEIDFVAEKQGKVEYYQVTYSLGNELIIHREFDPLLRIKDNFPKYVISMLDEIDLSQNGIIHLNMINFLNQSHV